MSEWLLTIYYPTTTNRHKHLPHRPAIIWRSCNYNHADYHLDTDSESSGLKMTPHLHVRAPSCTSCADINLGSEFSGGTNSPPPSSPLPLHPPNTVQTPDHTRSQLPLFPPNNARSDAFTDDLLSELHINGNLALSKTPPARKTPSLAPSRSSSKWTLYTLPPNSGQYAEESRPGSQNDCLSKFDPKRSSRTFTFITPRLYPNASLFKSHMIVIHDETKFSPIRPDIVLRPSGLVQLQGEITLQNPYPRDHLLPVESRDQDQVDSPHLDLPPDVLLDPTEVLIQMKKKNGKPFLEIELDTFHLNIPRIIMGRDMDLGFMDCYHLLLMCLVLHLLFLR